MSPTALIVVVPEAEALVGDLRLLYDEPARQGIPAHITLLFPFMGRADVSAEVAGTLENLCSSVAAFSFQLASIGRFDATSYLAPTPARPFIDLTLALWRAFPAYPPFAGEFSSIVPHLTVAHGDAGQAERASGELAARLARHGPVRSNGSAVALFERVSGRWEAVREFPLASCH